MKAWTLILLLIVGIFVATFLKLLLNAAADNGVAWDDPQYSELKAQRKGIYVCPVKATPNTFQWNGVMISFREVWIEHRVHTDHPYIWFSRINQSGGDYLCFTIDASRPIFREIPSPYFICSEGEFGGSAETINLDELFAVWLKPDAESSHNATLRLVKDQNDHNPLSIKLSW